MHDLVRQAVLAPSSHNTQCWRFRIVGHSICIAPDLTGHVIDGARVLAPCAGQVVNVVDGLPATQVPEVDCDHLAGNHALLRCANADVLLGYLRPGSVQVRAGAQVGVGDWLGSVGNSGNTGEPHLHIHAQSPGSTEAPLGGEPRPIQYGRFPLRGDRIDAP